MRKVRSGNGRRSGGHGILLAAMALSASGGPAVAAGTGDGGRPVVPGDITTGVMTRTATRVDVDGDGAAEVVLSGKDVVVVAAPDGQDPEILRAPDGEGSEFGVAVAAGDFDNDGFGDLAVGAPWTDAGTASHAGGVWVFHGGSQGLLDGTGNPVRHFALHQGGGGLPGAREEDDQCGFALAAGKFTGTRYDGLAVGCPGEGIGARGWAGGVVTIPGGPGGMATSAARSLTQSSAGVAGAPEAYDRFGAALAVADVTGDAVDDLVVGVPGENSVGGVHVLPGSGAGPTGSGSSVVSGNSVGIKPSPLSATDPGAEGNAALLGWSLDVADLSGDGTGDVLAGAPSARIGSVDACGAVVVMGGAPTGIRASRSRLVSQSSAGVAGTCEKGDSWGWAVAAGDLTGDGRPEAVVGAPDEAVGSKAAAGGYTVLHAGGTGLVGQGSFGVTQATRNVTGSPEPGDTFGWSVSVQDLNGDGRGDVVAGAPGEVLQGTPTGMVHLLVSDLTGRPAATSTALTGDGFSDAGGAVDWLGYGVGTHSVVEPADGA